MGGHQPRPAPKNIKPPTSGTGESKHDLATKKIDGPKLKCCYPTAPLLKKFDNDGNYTMAGDLACRSDLFMKVDLVGKLTLKQPYKFGKVGNVYQCVLCGAMYRTVEGGDLLMLLRDRWVRVDPTSGTIYLPDGTKKLVVLDVNNADEMASKQYIDGERKATNEQGEFSEFNI